VEEFDSNAATHLENSRRFLAEKQWGEAVEAIRRVMESDTGKFAQVAADGPLPIGFARYVSLREFCQQRLAALHREAPEALAEYRKLVDPLAGSWLREADSTHQAELLRRIVEQAFASRWGDDALLKLGDLALSRGDYAPARGYWQRIAPGLTVSSALEKPLASSIGTPLWLPVSRIDLDKRWEELAPHFAAAGEGPPGTYPDTDLNLADVRARLVLASILEGSLDRATVELALFRHLHPAAIGELAGKQGSFADLLDGLLAQAKAWPAPQQSSNWPTFAGNPARNRVVEQDIDPASAPLWSFALPKLESDRDLVGEGRLRVADDMKGLLSYFPIVVGDSVLLRVDAREKSYVTALELGSGKVRWQVDYPRLSHEHFGERAEPAADDQPWELGDAHAGFSRHAGVARYTLTALGDKVFARMGSPATAPQARRIEQVLEKDQGWLLGLDLKTEGKPLDGFPLQTDSAQWSFEGAPLADAGHFYVMMRHIEGSRSQMHVACFDLQTTPTASLKPADARATGRLRWRAKIAAASTLAGGDVAEISHNLLTLADGRLYCNTNLGAVAALDANDGRVQWLMKYPRGSFRTGDPEHNESHFFRDLNPCLMTGELVIVAPSDCERIFALEAATGRLVWTLPEGVAADAVHLLGVGDGTLLASGDFLYWIDVQTGRLLTQFPHGGPTGPTQAAPSPRGFGRGVLAGSHVYWPTRDAIFLFAQKPLKTSFGYEPVPAGVISLVPRGVTGGNLTIAGDLLLIATGDRLYALEANRKDAAR
jgi:hypothetical protein